jgi:hypothetical protein
MVALELQTRLVEEPYLSAVHGEEYAVYATQVGRFLPGDRPSAAQQQAGLGPRALTMSASLGTRA